MDIIEFKIQSLTLIIPFSIQLNTLEERISELSVESEENIQTEAQRKDKDRKY